MRPPSAHDTCFRAVTLYPFLATFESGDPRGEAGASHLVAFLCLTLVEDPYARYAGDGAARGCWPTGAKRRHTRPGQNWNAGGRLNAASSGAAASKSMRSLNASPDLT